ncbi:MAG: hypothetical protein DCF21_14245 [Leptolyngbya sp.]|nr:MAG: hypothetical protein DCF21_14245 [Leptolyngbya sp.]
MTLAIGEIVRNGVVFDMKNWNGDIANGDSLPQVIDRLFDLLDQRQISYLLVGGVALLSYVDGRNTQDVDFILARQSLRELPELVVVEEDKNFVGAAFEQLQIDLLLTQNPLFKLVLENYSTKRQFGDRPIYCATVEGLVLLKLYALPSLYSQGQFDKVSIYESDITLLMLRYPVDIDALETILKRYILATDLVELEQIVDDIQARMARFQQRQAPLDPGPEGEP